MKKQNYEIIVKDLITSAQVLNHNVSPCSKEFVPDTKVTVSGHVKTASEINTIVPYSNGFILTTKISIINKKLEVTFSVIVQLNHSKSFYYLF